MLTSIVLLTSVMSAPQANGRATRFERDSTGRVVAQIYRAQDQRLLAPKIR